MRVLIVRVAAIPHGKTWFVDSSAVEEGEQTVYVWLLDSEFSEAFASDLRARYEGHDVHGLQQVMEVLVGELLGAPAV